MKGQIIKKTIYVIVAIYIDINGNEKSRTFRQREAESYHTFFARYHQLQKDKTYINVNLYREKVVWEEVHDKLPAEEAQKQGRLF